MAVAAKTKRRERKVGIRGDPSRRRDATRAPARRCAPACPARHESLAPARRKARRRRGRVRPAPAALHATARAGRRGRPGKSVSRQGSAYAGHRQLRRSCRCRSGCARGAPSPSSPHRWRQGRPERLP